MALEPTNEDIKIGRKETIFEAVGGIEGLRRLCRTFYEAVLADPLIAPVFANFTTTHIEHVAVWLTEIFEGPTRYSDELGGHQALLKAHLGLSITEEQRTRWLELMDASVKQVFPVDEELQRSIMNYFDWGTKIARDVSSLPVDKDLGEPGPTPRWGLDGLKK